MVWIAQIEVAVFQNQRTGSLHCSCQQVLDVLSTVGDYHQLKEVAFFLLAPNVLPPEAALGLYISVGGGDWLYRGFVSSHCPSAVMPLSWPEQSPVNQALLGPGAVQIGVSVESYGKVQSDSTTSFVVQNVHNCLPCMYALPFRFT